MDNLKKKILGFCAVVMLLCQGHASASGVGYGIVQYDPDPFDWYVIVANHFSESTLAVTGIELDANSSSAATPWVWDSAFHLDGQPAPTFVGLGTPSLSLVGSLPAPLLPFDSSSFWRFRLFPDPRPGALVLPVDALLGVRVTFTFDDASTWTGVFQNEIPPVGDPYTDGIYMLREVAVPEPGSLALLGLGLAGLGLSRRRKA